MQTCCPHCNTQFRVTEAQINTADGFVRCGICEQVFNAFDVASQHKHQHSLLVKATAAETNTEENFNALSDTDVTDNVDKHIETQAAPDNEQNTTSETTSTEKTEKDSFDFFDETVNESLSHVVPDHFRENHLYSSKPVTSTIFWSIGTLLLSTTLCIEYIWFNRDQFSHITELQTLIDKTCEQLECNSMTLRDASK
ncbi:MAG: zinc-ribbon domain-containing protein, partial [Gammaproteobacteria bacterium]|nr:zinc-ribbon domain-containing protein [Gammaproteobacteria bacterium]